MDEQDQKSLTVGDILDQLVKPSVVQGPPVVQPRPQAPASAPAGMSSGFNLPKLGGNIVAPPVLGQSPIANTAIGGQPSQPRLFIRTMADDLARIKKGQAPKGAEADQRVSGEKYQKPESKLPGMAARPAPVPRPQLRPAPGPSLPTLPSPPKPLPVPPPSLKMAPLPNQPIHMPTIRPAPAMPSVPSETSLPGLPQLDTKSAPPPPLPPDLSLRIKEEIHIPHGDEDLLPPFPGAPIPKKIAKPQEEKVEYGLIARVIGSGMTTGIISTVVLAVLVYFLITFWVLNDEEEDIIVVTPTPPIQSVQPELSELETIFKNIGVVYFALSEDNVQAVSRLNNFIDGQNIEQKEFKRIVFSLGQENRIVFSDLMDRLGIHYPQELRDLVVDSNLALLYGQQEVFGDAGQATQKRIVFITEVKDAEKVREIMRSWESAMPNDLRHIFGIDPTKEATRQFLDNERQGTPIRYKNFPLPDRSIDYAVVRSFSGRDYLLLTNSREAMFSPTDKIKGL